MKSLLSGWLPLFRNDDACGVVLVGRAGLDGICFSLRTNLSQRTAPEEKQNALRLRPHPVDGGYEQRISRFSSFARL